MAFITSVHHSSTVIYVIDSQVLLFHAAPVVDVIVVGTVVVVVNVCVCVAILVNG